MKIKFRKVVEYKKGMVSDSNEIIKVDDEHYIFGLQTPSTSNSYLGRLSTTPTGDWISQYGMEHDLLAYGHTSTISMI